MKKKVNKQRFGFIDPDCFKEAIDSATLVTDLLECEVECIRKCDALGLDPIEVRKLAYENMKDVERRIQKGEI